MYAAANATQQPTAEFIGRVWHYCRTRCGDPAQEGPGRVGGCGEWNGLSYRFRALLHQGYCHLQALDAQIAAYGRELKEQVKASDAARRLLTIPGFGPVVSSVYLNAVGDGKTFRRGRDVSAALGIVPRQHSSGDKPVLLGISKRGNGYLRSVLIHGARSVVKHADQKDDALSRWVRQLVQRRGTHKATVALANKLARIGWAVLTGGGVYQSSRV